MTTQLELQGVRRPKKKTSTYSVNIQTKQILAILSEQSRFSMTQIIDGLVMKRAKYVIDKKLPGSKELAQILGQGMSTIYQ